MEMIGSMMNWSWPAVFPFDLRMSAEMLFLFSVARFVGFLFLAITLTSLFEKPLSNVVSSIAHHKVKVFVAGLTAGLLFIPVIVALIVSLIGIVLIPVWLLVFAAAVLFGYIGVSQFVGKKILQAFRWHQKPPVVDAVIGVTALYLIGLVPLAGFIVKIIVGCWGLGAVIDTRFGVVKGR